MEKSLSFAETNTVVQAQLIKVRLEVKMSGKSIPAQPIKIMPQGKD